MFFRLLLLFLLTPVVELGLLIKLGQFIGFWPTLGLIFVTGLTGSYLAKREGLSVWQRFQERLNKGALPGRELLDGVIILVAGALLITPGVLTDVVGFIGLVPVTRRLVRRVVLKRLEKAAQGGNLQVRFGRFDQAGWSTDKTSWEEKNAPGQAEQETDWRGQGRDVPGHTSEKRQDS